MSPWSRPPRPTPTAPGGLTRTPTTPCSVASQRWSGRWCSTAAPAWTIPRARAVLACADQLVLVCDDQPDTASIVAEAVAWLAQIAPPLVLAVNNVRRRSRIDIAALQRETTIARGVVAVPRDERAAGQLYRSRFSWNRAPAGWRTPVRELAALLAADWQRLLLTY